MKKKGFIGVLIIVLAILGIFTWEAFGRSYLTYDKVIALKSNVEQSDLIKKDMVIEIRVPVKQKDALLVKDKDKIIGKEVKHFIHQNTQLFSEYFDDRGLVTDKGEYIFSLPNDWVKAFPQSLRRGDTAYFYLVSNMGDIPPKFITSAKVAFVKDNTNNEVISNDTKRLSGSSTVSLIEIVVVKKQAELLASSVSNSLKLVIMYR